MEEWRKITYSDDYEVSSHGRIRRTKKGRNTFPGMIRKCRAGRGGYLYFNITIDGKRKTLKVHRMVAETFLGPPPTPKHQVAHYDGDRLHNHLSNLRWATHSENLKDRHRHGTHMLGERNQKAKLTPDQVLAIRNEYASGAANTYGLAKKYGVYHTNIQKIIRREIWTHL